MATTLKQKLAARTVVPRILLVDDEPQMLEAITDIVSRQIKCRITTATTRAQALKVIRNEPVELLIADIRLPDGDGLSLLKSLRQSQPLARAIIITGEPSVQCAVEALREGAVDFIAKPFSADELVNHVASAVDRQAKLAREEARLDRLRDTVKRLNAARKVVSKKVDLLCNDLISAYGDLARQMDSVRTQEAFRKYIDQTHDLEQLLCHAMDWALRQFGYSNIAIWLAADDNQYQLGAYMKYTIPGDIDLAQAMQTGCLPVVLREGAIHWSAEDVQQRMSEQELDYLADQTVMGVNCTYLGEPLGAMIIFRQGDKPFKQEDYELLKLISPILATALASVAREGGKQDLSDAPFFDGGMDSDAPAQGDGKENDDWWKRGEAPPF